MFETIFLIENIVIAIMAVTMISVPPFSEKRSATKMFGGLFSLHFLGLALKVIYYKFFHVWKNLNIRVDWKAVHEGDSEWLKRKDKSETIFSFFKKDNVP